jgi:hypothetical protein
MNMHEDAQKLIAAVKGLLLENLEIYSYKKEVDSDRTYESVGMRLDKLHVTLSIHDFRKKESEK